MSQKVLRSEEVETRIVERELPIDSWLRSSSSPVCSGTGSNADTVNKGQGEISGFINGNLNSGRKVFEFFSRDGRPLLTVERA